jgi:hypothetical protein
MKPPIKWLTEQKEKAERDLAEAKKRLEAISLVLELAQRRVESAEIVLGMARQEKKPPRKQGINLRLASEALATKALSSRDLQIYLSQQGHVTTSNSINTSLNRYRSRCFDKKEGKWYLTSQPTLRLIGSS